MINPTLVQLTTEYADCDALLSDLAAGIAPRFTLDHNDPHARRCIYLDTFDWRIHRAGLCLKRYGQSPRFTFTLEDLTGQQVARSGAASAAAFAEALPDGALRERLAPISSVRRLLSKATVAEHVVTFNVRDVRKKIVARGEFASRAAAPQSAPLPGILRIAPLRGFARPFADIRAAMEPLGLVALTEGEYLQGLPEADSPADAGGDVHLHLEADQDAVQSAKRVFLQLLQRIVNQHEGILKDLDIEFVHDYRVAIRRTRSILKNLRGVLPESIRAHFNREMANAVRPTGPVRDLDVYLLKLGDYLKGLPDDARADFEPLIEQARIQREQAQRRLNRMLRSAGYSKTLDDWRAYLNTHEDASDAGLSILNVARKKIWKAYRRLREAGDAIEDHHAEERLHELRIDGKRLRYALEAFGSLFPATEIRQLTRQLKQLQDNLGDLQDIAVHRDMLREHCAALPDGAGRTAAILAAGRMLAHLDTLALAEKQRFHGIYPAFRAPDQDRLYRELFKRKAS